jgi:RNA polymerase sigma-70 factor (ECF subfamily)
MSDPATRSTAIQRHLDRLRMGDPAARAELLAIASDRLLWLARKMLRADPRVRRWEQTDDVFQEATLRLHQALADVRPQTVRDFFGLAAMQVRRVLIDLARHYYGPQGLGAHHASRPAIGGERSDGMPCPPFDIPDDETYDPARLASWTEFHRQIGELPDEEREAFDLLWYHGLTQAEAAEVLGTTERVVGSRWRRARLRLHRQLGGALPGM